MIILTRLNGPAFALNPDLVERADSTPDTVITLVDGTKYVVGESLTELISLIRRYRAGVVADAQQMIGQAPAAAHQDDGHLDESTPAPARSNVVQLHRRER